MSCASRAEFERHSYTFFANVLQIPPCVALGQYITPARRNGPESLRLLRSPRRFTLMGYLPMMQKGCILWLACLVL